MRHAQLTALSHFDLRRVALRLACALAVALAAPLVPTGARAQEPSAQYRAADSLLRAGEWQRAADAFAAVARVEPGNTAAWVRLGVALDRLGEHQRAIEAFTGANQTRPQAGVWYRIAVSEAKLGRKEQSFRALEEAMAAGFADAETYGAEAAFAPFRDDARFRVLPARLAAVDHPCASRPEFRALDFWIGEWEQQTKIGQVVGTSVVRAVHDGCALLEETVNPPRYTASAFHHFDPTTRSWRQSYVSSRAEYTSWTGEVANGVARYVQTVGPGERKRSRNTMTRETPDRIRWLFETSADGGRTWAVFFDGYYVRKES